MNQVCEMPVGIQADDHQHAEYIRAGWALVPIPPQTKGPILSGWNKRENCVTSPEQVPIGHGVGLAHAYSGTCSIDIDDLGESTRMLAEHGIDLQALLDAPDAVQIHSGNPGHAKLIYALPFALPSKKISFKAPDGQNKVAYEFRCASASGTTVQDVLPPSIHPVTLKPYQWAGKGHWQHLPPLPDALLALWQGIIDQDAERTIRNTDDLPASWEEITSALYTIPASCGNDDWVTVGMALHQAGTASGQLDQAQALYDEWSSTGGDKYKGPRDVATRWRSFKADPEGIKLGSLFHLAKQHGWVRPVPDVSGMFSSVDQPGTSFPSLRKHELADLQKARLTPKSILDGLLFADVRIRVAAGGVGKTTLALFEMATLALKKPLYGYFPERPIRSVILSREDGMEILLGRLREVCKAIDLTESEVLTVLENIRILDLSDRPFRISTIEKDIVRPDMETVDWITNELSPFKPDWVIFDPLVSFGVGESRVNDAEQGIIEAFRIIRNRLDCVVEGIHHTGKAVARDKTQDQYAGRGGSALADGARMVTVMQPLSHDEWRKTTGTPLGDHSTGFVMAFPKTSFTKPREPLYIARMGFAFKVVHAIKLSPEDRRMHNKDKVADFVEAEFNAGRHHSATELERFADEVGLSRAEMRKAIADLKNDPRFTYHESAGKKGSHFEV